MMASLLARAEFEELHVNANSRLCVYCSDKISFAQSNDQDWERKAS